MQTYIVVTMISVSYTHLDVYKRQLYDKGQIAICTHKIGQPTVFIPTFPGTNCEVDSAKAMEAAGARAVVKIMRNLSAEDIRYSVEELSLIHI